MSYLILTVVIFYIMYFTL